MAAEDIAFENGDWLHLRATPRVSAALSQLNVFIVHQLELPVNPDFIVRIAKNIRFENYTSSHGQLYAAGAFTYSENVVTPVSAGRYCSIGPHLNVMGERHPIEQVTTSSFTYCYLPHYNKPQFLRAHEQLLDNAYPAKRPAVQTGPLPKLEHDVWIGQQVILQRGITLHSGCVVGAGAVVTKSVPPYTIVAGNPARPLRTRFAPELCANLLATEWWKYHPKILFEFDRSDPERFCGDMQDALAKHSLEPLAVRQLDWKDVVAKLDELEMKEKAAK